MAVKTIGSGGDYATPALWFASLAATLSSDETGRVLSAAEIVVAASQTLAIDSNGFTVTLEAQTGESFADSPTNPLRYVAANGAAIRMTDSAVFFDITTANFVFRRLMLKKDSLFGDGIIAGTGASGFVMDRCVMEFDNNAAGWGGGSGGGTLTNCVLIHNGSNGNYNVGYVAFGGGGTWNISNCGAARTVGAGSNNDGFSRYNGTMVLTNCWSYGFATDYSGTFSASSTNNATDKGTIGGTNLGTNAQVSLDGPTEFNSVTDGSEDFRLNTTSVKLKANGTATGAPSADIFAESWNSGVPDIGPDRFPLSTANDWVPPPVQALVRQPRRVVGY